MSDPWSGYGLLMLGNAEPASVWPAVGSDFPMKTFSSRLHDMHRGSAHSTVLTHFRCHTNLYLRVMGSSSRRVTETEINTKAMGNLV